MLPATAAASIMIDMTAKLPVSALLSQLLVAFTIEFDNEFEHRIAHRTTRHGASAPSGGPWLVSQVMCPT